MTLLANRNNIEPMLWFIAVPMMVLLRRFRAIIALQSIGMGQLSNTNCATHSTFGFKTIWVSDIKSFSGCSSYGFAFICFVIRFISCFALFSFEIFSQSFAISCFTLFALLIPFSGSFPLFSFKIPFLGCIFVIFAFGTPFRYDFSSHNQLLSSWLRLEPQSRPMRLCGSLNYKTSRLQVNEK